MSADLYEAAAQAWRARDRAAEDLAYAVDAWLRWRCYGHHGARAEGEMLGSRFRWRELQQAAIDATIAMTPPT